jgi:hypothetical protein
MNRLPVTVEDPRRADASRALPTRPKTASNRRLGDRVAGGGADLSSGQVALLAERLLDPGACLGQLRPLVGFSGRQRLRLRRFLVEPGGLWPRSEIVLGLRPTCGSLCEHLAKALKSREVRDPLGDGEMVTRQ